MIFHSFVFLVFFVVVVAAHWALPHRLRNRLLLVASYVFYGWVHPWFVGLILFTTVIDFWAARGIEEWPGGRRFMLGLSLCANLGVLGFFKYFNFFADNVHAALAVVGLDVSAPVLRVILPVGISFYTFQALSYTIDVYRGRLTARRNFIDFATFVALFPQLVAGPIERATHLLPQVEQPRTLSWPAARDGFVLAVWGYFKKLVIADNVGIIADKIFSLESPGFPLLWAGVFAFAIQIYADFSAYTDIARGVGRFFGFSLMRNFRHPYMATGPADFWHRWHISLSTWFRDYVFIPLGGSRGGRWTTVRNIMITFVVSGLWHGASWNFALWGAYHGVLVAVSHVMPRVSLSPAARRALAPARMLGTFVLVLIGWLMFRETDSTYLWRSLTMTPFGVSAEDWRIGGYLFLLSCVYSIPLWVESFWAEWTGRSRAEEPESPATWHPGHLVGRALLVGAAVAAIVVFRSRQSLDFIYFQF
jgi:D-alanyl-lipoteichoic acid acyltransferase DltB (MBOAT superfamily)